MNFLGRLLFQRGLLIRQGRSILMFNKTRIMDKILGTKQRNQGKAELDRNFKL